jgi:hypothetical protein
MTKPNKKPMILFTCDVHGWAYWNRIQRLKKALPQYDLVTFYFGRQIPLNLQRKMLREADIIVAQGVKALRIVQMKEMHLAAPDYESELLRRYDNVIARLDSVRVDKDGEYYDIFTGEQIEED